MKKYMTSTTKERYMKDFFDNVLTCTNEAWKLCDGVKDTLIEINKNTNIQTLYSRRISKPDDFWEGPDYTPISFIVLTFTKGMEGAIVRTGRLFEVKFGDEFILAKMKPTKRPPEKNLEQFQDENDDARKMGCLNDENWFNVVHYFFQLNSDNIETHTKFWNDILKYLPGLKASS